MSLWRRIKFVYRVYRGLIPAIWRSWRSPAYDPPTYEEMMEFTRGVDVTPTCRRVSPMWKEKAQSPCPPTTQKAAGG